MTNLVIISTVGASLLTNYARKIGKGTEFLDEIEDIDDQQLVKLKNDLLDYLRGLDKDYGKASAELNSIFDILRKIDTSKYREIEIMFVISDTKQAKIIREVLEKFITSHIREFNNKPLKTYHDIIEGLNYKDIEHATKGLPTLAIRIAEWIKNKRAIGNEVILNITGGFKAESIYAAMVGLLAQIPVYYMHEKFRTAVKLPPLIKELSDDVEILLEIVKSFYEQHKK